MLLKNAKVGGKYTDIRIENGVIAEIGQIDGEGMDLNGMKVYPGLIDIHTHGCIGLDVMRKGDLPEMCKFWASRGTTAWLATTETADMEITKGVVNQPIDGLEGAQILGFHLEGPYISSGKHVGAMDARFVKDPDPDEVRSMNNVAMITMAPEKKGGLDFIRNCDAIICIGHTDTDYDGAIEAIEAGANCMTHTFNAMPPLHHRDVGPIGAAIDKNIYAQVICDGRHVHPSIVKMLYRTFGADRVILISDAVTSMGMPDGRYVSGGLPIIVKDSVARVEDGALAGGSGSMLDGVKKAIEFGISEEDAFRMGTQTPAELLGVKKGKIEVGYDADLIALDDDLNLKHTIIAGKLFEA